MLLRLLELSDALQQGKREKGDSMVENKSYLVRLKAVLGKPLTSDEKIIQLSLKGREVALKPDNPGKTLKESKWIIASVKGFASEAEATEYGERLRSSIELAALGARVGIDTGRDKPISTVNEDWARESGLLGERYVLRPDIHGLMIIPNDGRTKIPFVSGGEMKVTSDPDQFTMALSEVFHHTSAWHLGDTKSLRLLNLAIINPDPLATIALAFSSVEALGQNETWSPYQKSILEKCARELEANPTTPGHEDLEVAEAIRRGTHRVGLRQGVLRVLSRLNLDGLKNEWDRLYSIRSGLIHGTREWEPHELG